MGNPRPFTQSLPMRGGMQAPVRAASLFGSSLSLQSQGGLALAGRKKKHKFTAYMGLQDNDYTDLLQAAEQATAELTEIQLRAAASTIEDGERHDRLSTDLRYILINTTTGAAATVCRQYQHTIGFEMYRQLCIRFSIPLGTRSIGHLTRLWKPTFDKNNFEESFSTWEFELLYNDLSETMDKHSQTP